MDIGFTCLLLTVGSIYDIKYKALPRWFLAGAAFLALLIEVVFCSAGIWSMIGGIMTGLILLLISFFTRGAIGRGDGFVIGIMGLYLGFSAVFFIFTVAVILMSLLALALLILRRVNRKTALPFLPFLWISYVLYCLNYIK